MERQIDVRDLLGDDAADLQCRLLAGETGLDRKITSPRIQKPGLALAGFVDFLHDGRVQLFGRTELAYLDRLTEAEQEASCRGFLAKNVSCIVCTKGMNIADVLAAVCEETATPLMSTPQMTATFISRIETWLEDRLAPKTNMHAVLLEIFGVGVLLLGKSGIGKSECALDLIQRGHRLVADDMVSIRRRGTETIYGTGNKMLRHHMEIRGLGILNVRELFGITATRDKKRIDIVAELVQWNEDEEYDRLGLEERRFPILDVELPLLTVPVRPGRNMGAIIEVAARNQVLRQMGVNSASLLNERLEGELAPGRRVATDDLE